MQPLLRVRTKPFSEKICPRCGNHLGPEDFAPTKSWFYPDGVLPICDECCAQYGSRPFTDFLDKVMSFQEYKEASDKAAAGFQYAGIGRNTH